MELSTVATKIDRGVKRYLFYRIWRDEKFYLFCRSVGTPNRSNAALFTKADWLEWGEREGLEREEVEDQ